MKAISYPLRQIAENAGQEGSIVVQKVMGINGKESESHRIFLQNLVFLKIGRTKLQEIWAPAILCISR